MLNGKKDKDEEPSKEQQQSQLASQPAPDQLIELTAKLINDIGEYLASKPWRETNNLIQEIRRQCFVYEQQQRATAEEASRKKATEIKDKKADNKGK